MMKIAPYHHGALPEALLAAAEVVLRRNGLSALTLRAIAREAGVSHAAVTHHFRDMTGLLSELAAVGFRRFADALLRATAAPSPGPWPGSHAYVRFAEENRDMFLLMFRSERLDTARPALNDALAAAFNVLGRLRGVPLAKPTLSQLAEITATWSFIHGFAMLLMDGRLNPIFEAAPRGTDVKVLLNATLNSLGISLPPVMRKS